MNYKSTALFVCLLALSFPSNNTSAEDAGWKILKIPSSIEVNQDIRTVPEGWLPTKEEGRHVVAGITIFDGRPEEMASLVYDREVRQRSKHRMILSWRLFPNTKNGIWLRCSYSSTNISLSAPLSPKAKELRVVYDTDVHIDGLPQIVQIEYRE
jgi:hypothetical protein